MMNRKLLSAIWLVSLLTSPSLAQQVSFENVPSELQPKYDAQKAEITALVGQIQDKKLAGEVRAAHLAELQQRFPYVVLPTAKSVALDESEPLQLEATKILIGSVVMMNHSAGGDHAMHEQFTSTMDILKQVVASGTAAARSFAAETGASLGDSGMLSEIQKKNDEGVISDADAVGYFTLADPGVAASYVEKYLSSENVAAQEQAVSYLGPLPDYQATIRQDFFLDANKPAAVQAAAARVLARTDEKFTTYSDKVIMRDGTPTQVVDAIIRGSIENTTNPVNAEQVSKYKTILDDYKKANPGVNMQQLNTIQNSIEILR
ncbi:hypothetical protein [Rhizobium anhuiense]|uniref:hypothetical protein n=1 Tax=Rhizobium anhuiense TaxID=1184720 RepID=UPI0020CBCE8E|nr:hypothetical protein [Rhizobium anhuiense]UTS90332.1 hypothetical protein NE851_27585 [Rhizobium anhuiense bv. trifolii]